MTRVFDQIPLKWYPFSMKNAKLLFSPARFFAAAISIQVSNPCFAGTSPKYGPTATRLYHSREFIKKNPSPDFWALSPYYLPQQDARSCSLAAAAMVVNAARSSMDLFAEDELVSQKGLLEKVNLPIWKEGLGEGGRGISLDQFAPVLEASLKAYGFKNASVTLLHADSTDEFKKKVHADLIQNEKSATDFIIANYLQSEFTGDPEGAVGHYAPVAAYDSKSKKVLIFDPDRQYYEPYWVSENTFIKGMNTVDLGKKATRGYLQVKTGNR
jgi:hypothetical protein